MSLDAAVRGHAEQLAAERLSEASGRLNALDPDRRRAVEQLAYAVAAGVADCLLAEATRSPAVSAALSTIYNAAPGASQRRLAESSSHDDARRRGALRGARQGRREPQ